ncbi:MAG: SDR family oxidoreductase [Candidatus Saganbacteria bacterium]|nr:SDR family oxidoreductase [Candidatus Saganbacteria bacterium]
MKKIRVGITGHSGFIGSHLVNCLSREQNISIVSIDDGLFDDLDNLAIRIKDCDCVVHLAGMNRGSEEEIYSTNIKLAKGLVKCFDKPMKTPHLIFASSILNATDSAFGKSKKEAEQIFMSWAKQSKAALSIFVIPNVFGSFGKPFYNSVVATFCYQLTHGERPKIINDRELELIYINELTEVIKNRIDKQPDSIETIRIPGTKKSSVTALLDILLDFKEHYFIKKVIPALPEQFLVNLYNVFISYLDYTQLEYSPKLHVDNRGELCEIIKLAEGGQVFFSTTKPGVIRGDHYHTRKFERFCVVLGSATIRLRKIGTQDVKEYKVDGKDPQFIEIPVLHTHHIENAGAVDLYTVFWCNEVFDPANADTYAEEVLLD